MGSMGLLEEQNLNQDQMEIVRTAQICGEQLLYVINDILGNVTSKLVYLKEIFCNFSYF